jgi:hypothetical protein
VLDAWQQSPARFRADANVEDDLALTGYRDRVVVELAQNAADAATREGRPGLVGFDLAGDVLTAWNVGEPLDAAGVESISVARASAKDGQVDLVGRFGVGFAAVLAVSDEPSISSRTGAVRWSRADALAAVAAVPELRPELDNRGDRIPVLRLPFATDPGRRPAPEPFTDGAAGLLPRLPPDGPDTVVVLPLCDPESVTAVRAQLEALDSTLLFSLPALGGVVIRVDGAERVIAAGYDAPRDTAGEVTVRDGDVASCWWVEDGEGELPADLLADRPAEERRFERWQLAWAIPIDARQRVVEPPGSVAAVVRAPTAVDDPLTIPAVLVASYPLDSNRRRVTAGPLADAVTAHAADVLVDAILALPPDPSVLRLVPTGFPDGEVDGSLHTAVRYRLAEAAWLPLAADPQVRQRPRQAVLVADELVDVLRDVLPAILPAGWERPELTGMGVRRLELAELVEALLTVEQRPGWWRSLYDAVGAAVPPGPERDALAALPVPLTDGTMAAGPRGLVLADPDVSFTDLSALGIRMVHPDAVHPLLRTFGAVDGAARDLLEQPQVQAAVAESYDEDDPEPIAAAVLSLLAATGVGADEMPWLAELALTDVTGEWRPAGELVLPDGLMARSIASDSAFGVVAEEWVSRYGRAAVAAAGVIDGPALLRDADAVGPTHDLDDEAAWWSALPTDAAVENFVAVRDLEQIGDGSLGDVVAALAEPPLRSAIVDPAIVTLLDGERLRRRSYTAWWLSTRPVIDGSAPSQLRLAGSDPRLEPLYDVARSDLDEELLRALGVLGSLADADPDDVLRRLAEPDRVLRREQLRALDGWLATAAMQAPERVRAVRRGAIEVVPAADAVVVDAPDLLGLLGNLAVVPVSLRLAADLAERLRVALASDLATYEVRSRGVPEGDLLLHDRLLVGDVNGDEREVAWRFCDDVLHVDRRNLAVGAGRGRAWRDRAWSQRHRRTEVLLDLPAGMMRDDEDDLDDNDER